MSDLTVYVNGYKSQTRSIRHQGSETVIDFKMANEKGEHLLKANFDRYRLDEKPLVKCKSPHQTLQEIKS